MSPFNPPSSATQDSARILAAAHAALERQRDAEGGVKTVEMGGQGGRRPAGPGVIAIQLLLGFALIRWLGVLTSGFIIVGLIVGRRYWRHASSHRAERRAARRAKRQAPPVSRPTPRPVAPARGNRQKNGLSELLDLARHWLRERQSRLPPTARPCAAQICGHLDVLGELAGLDDHPAVAQRLRQLIEEELPRLVSAYINIPASLHDEKRTGSSADGYLVAGLIRIEEQIGSITRQLAEGMIDELATQAHFLDMKYGEGAANLSS